MKVHIHDNNRVPIEQNCLSETDLEPGSVLTLHLHPGECLTCPKGHCHDGSLNLLIVEGALYVVFEGLQIPTLITSADMQLHAPLTHRASKYE